jgi:hypothetical protein
LLAHGRWFSSGTPASSTTKTGRHDIAEIMFVFLFNDRGLASLSIKGYMSTNYMTLSLRRVFDVSQITLMIGNFSLEEHGQVELV